MPSKDRLRQEAERLLRLIRSTKFENCLPFVPKHKNLSFAAGIYAIKRVNDEVLYVGIASAFRTRFQSSGHKALERMFLDEVNVKEVRILLIPFSARYLDHMLLLEKHLIFCLAPKYNERMPRVDELQMLTQTPITGSLKDVLRYLPDHIIDALEDHADTYGLTDLQVIELAIVQMLDLDTTSLGDVSQAKTLAQYKEENAILKLRLQALGQPVE